MSSKQPIFQSIFAEQWETLPAVMHKHYANRPYCDDVVKVEGKMDVEFGTLVTWLSPLLRLFGALVPYQGHDIPVTVFFRSEKNSNTYCLDRHFHFANKPAYIFYSRMVPIKKNIIVEYMKYGIGWKHRFYFDGNKVILEHCGYVWRFFGLGLPIPLGLFLGKGYAEEEALSETRFRMKMTIEHFLFGRMYEYRGEFEMCDE